MKALLPKGRLIESMRLRRRPDWLAAIVAGLGSGAGMLAALALAQASLPEFWDFLRRSAAILLGSSALGPAGLFEASIAVTGLVVHFALAVVFALVLADAVYRLQWKAAITMGVVYGLALYFINYHAFTLLFPWFAEERGPGMALTHAAYGAAAAYLYGRWARPITTS